MPSLNIHRNDTVKVLTGADRGKTGRVLRAFPDDGTVLVEHVRVVKRRFPSKTGQRTKGGIAGMSRPSTFQTWRWCAPTAAQRAWAPRSRATAGCAFARSAGRNCPPRSRGSFQLIRRQAGRIGWGRRRELEASS